MKKIKVAPSILSADFTRIYEDVKNVEKAGADLIHMDVMDGIFVPNITFGMKMVKDLRKKTELPLDCHLMIVAPEKYVESFASAGADYITIHYEACPLNYIEVLKKIRSLGVKAGIAINPNTDAAKIVDALPYVDMVLVMSVYPGFGGQKVISETLESVRKFDELKKENGYSYEIEIDGGINQETFKQATDAGVTILVAGSYVFKAKPEDMLETINSLRR